jgi:hypothetical protein
MSLVLRSQIGRRVTISEMDGNFTYLQELALSGTTSNINSYVEVTYSELISSINSSSLNPGTYYMITDFRTCYDQPDYDLYREPITSDNYKQGENVPLMVLSTSTYSIGDYAWQSDFPKDRIKYDYSWTQSEITGGTAYGRITERIDEWNNRTDYDHREVMFKRYNIFTYEFNSPQAGTISVVDGVVTGVETTFTNFSVNDVIVIPYFSEKYFKINTIDSDTQMSLTGSVWNVTGNDIKYYSVDSMGYNSYYRNNVDNDYEEYKTFGPLENGNVFNNYIGDHANSYIFDGIGDFVLSNNVFLNDTYYNNKFGNNCYNNTFEDDCTNNTIGNFFRNNITDDDFDGNQICNYFQNNLITANFQRNHVGENFEDNIIINDNFYRNRIGERFEENKISGNDFQNNIIGNAFNNNDLDLDNDGFLKNVIGVGFNNNILNGEFDSNTIGNGSNDNEFYGNIYENKIGDYFENNNFGTNVSSIDFYENHIGNDFQDNNVFAAFYNNKISNDCYSNYFYSVFYKNEIRNDFENNTIGEETEISNYEFYLNNIGNDVKSNFFVGHIYNNTFGNQFYSNQIYNDTYNNIFGNLNIFNDFSQIFHSNIIGNNFYSNIIGTSFTENIIADDFQENNIGNNFGFNQIGYNFSNNTIENDFGYGYDQAQGNKIGNYFVNNTIGEYFYNNQVADVFDGNIVGDYFQLNDIKIQNVYDYDFTTNLHKIVSIAFTATGSSATDGTYSNISGDTTSSINGTNSTFDILVNSGIVTSVSINNPGKFYEDNDEITILGTQIGGTASSDNIEIRITDIYTPAAYGNYNCDIFKRKDGEYRLSYYDEDDILTIKDINE